MSSSRAAVVLGASGSVGQALIRELIGNGSFAPVVTVVRRSQPAQVALARDAGVELREALVPAMAPADLETATREAVRSLPGDVVGLSVLGVGAGTAKLTINEHRSVDVELNAAFARGLKASGRVQHLAFMSAAGANSAAAETGSGAAGMARYARVKGEAEEAVMAGGPAVVSIFRPAMIIGSQHTPWLLEKVLPVFSFLTPAKYRSITVAQIARAMVATSLNTPSQSSIYHYPEMMALNREPAPLAFREYSSIFVSTQSLPRLRRETGPVMSTTEPHLDLFLNLNRIHAVISRRFDAELGGLHGVGLNDFHLLCALDEAPQQRLRRVDLARQLGLTPSGVTWILRPLIKRRLVASEGSTADARVAFAVLTPAGRRLIADVRPSARHLAQAILDEHPDKREARQATAFISRLG